MTIKQKLEIYKDIRNYREKLDRVKKWDLDIENFLNDGRNKNIIAVFNDTDEFGKLITTYYYQLVEEK
ncbi:MAG: hypothetical protein ABIJ97_03205 [Bacteroidota bacterium]